MVDVLSSMSMSAYLVLFSGAIIVVIACVDPEIPFWPAPLRRWCILLAIPVLVGLIGSPPGKKHYAGDYGAGFDQMYQMDLTQPETAAPSEGEPIPITLEAPDFSQMGAHTPRLTQRPMRLGVLVSALIAGIIVVRVVTSRVRQGRPALMSEPDPDDISDETTD